jgi:acetyltransferase-like isoleucine patch superfamily enzyme
MSEKREVDLHALHSTESALQRYRRLVAGQQVSIPQWMCQEVLFTLIAGVKGALGLVLRRMLYPRILSSLHHDAVIGSDVMLRCPQQVVLHKGVILDDACQLIATSTVPDAIVLGEGTFVRSFASLNAGPPDGFIRIGRHSAIGQHSVLYGNGGLTIGDNVMIAGHCFIVASSHKAEVGHIPFNRQGITLQGINIGNNVWIGAGVRILDGVTIGENSVVAANAVVNRSIPPNSRVGGVPARPLRRTDGTEQGGDAVQQ